MTQTTAQPASEETGGLQIESGRGGATGPILPPVRAAVKTRADRDQAADLLAVLGLDRGLIQVKCFDRASKLRLYWYDSPAALLRDWRRLEATNRAGYGVYFGVATYREDSGTKDKTAWLWTVHADLDGKDYASDWRTGKPLSLDMIANLPDNLQPAVLVDTGHGIHAYWPLRDPLPATAENIAAVEAVNDALADILDSDPAVKDVSRVMRLPGLLNVNCTWLENPEPLPVVLFGGIDGRRFNLADFEPIMPQKQAPAPVIDGASEATGNRPGDDFNKRGSWPELLEPRGWVWVGKKKADGASYLLRPGKDSGISARLNHGGDGLLRVYSSNAGALQSGTSYTLFGAYAALQHGGDFRAATKALAALGYGEQNGTDPKPAAVASNGATPKEAPPTRWSTMADLDGVLGDISWDWEGWIAAGFAHLIVAEPGVGKSMLALRTSASYLLGWPWPDGTPFRGETGMVLWCETEAGHAPNRERAKAWGLPTERILYPVENPLDSISLQDMEHMATVRYLAQRDDVKLIVVDSFSGGNTRDENDAESGQVVKMLAEIARDTNKPLLVTHHLNKGWRSNRITLTNIRGSTAIAQYVRLIWALDKPDPDQAALRLYAIKSNLAELPSEIGLSIGANGLTTLPQAPQVPRGDTVLDRAIDFLLDALEREPLPKREIEALAEEMSISGASLRRAADKLAVVKLKNRDGPWMWSLPAKTGAESLQ
jgi:hypothetical protein